MAIEALVVALSQGTECTQATYQDATDYTSEDIPAQRFEYETITPPATVGKTNVPLQFTSGATSVLLNVAILSGDTVAQRVAKIVAAINGNATIAAIVTAVDDTTTATVTADAEDVDFAFTNPVESGTDLAVTITNFPFSTRTLTFEYFVGTDLESETVDFPYAAGTGDEYELTPLAKDYAIKTTMIITPQVAEVGSTYTSVIYPVFACNAQVAKAEIADNYAVDMQNILCSNPKLDKMSAIDANISASQYAASAGNLAQAQALLDQANAICN